MMITRNYHSRKIQIPLIPVFLLISACTAVRYRDMWFWIDDRDLNSKRMFAFVMLLFSLTETGGDQRAPIVTVPTN